MINPQRFTSRQDKLFIAAVLAVLVAGVALVANTVGTAAAVGFYALCLAIVLIMAGRPRLAVSTGPGLQLTLAVHTRWPAGPLPDVGQRADDAEAVEAAVARCRVCGCTEDCACDGGCWWVPDLRGGDLCSACPPGLPPGPETVALCGSTRFKAEFEAANRQLTLDGAIVLAPGVFGHADGITVTDEQKTALDALHLAKIDRANWVQVINPGGYIGASTRAEIAHAHSRSLLVRYLQPPEGIPAQGCRLIGPAGRIWRPDGYGRVARVDCPGCQGSGQRPTGGGCYCRQAMRVVLPHALARSALEQMDPSYRVPAALLYEPAEGGDLVAGVALTGDLRRGLAAISATVRSNLGQRLRDSGVNWPQRVTAVRLASLLITVDLQDALLAEAGELQRLEWDAQPAVRTDDPEAVQVTWAEIGDW